MNSNKDSIKMNCCKLIIGLFNFVTFILLLVWLFKIINNAKSEPKNYAYFISNDVPQNYTLGDFCYGRQYEYLQNGAFEVFNIRMEKIKKFAKALVATKFISMGIVIFISILRVCQFKRNKVVVIIIILLIVIIFITNNILNVIFIEKLNSYFSESNFHDFEKFSNCDYISPTFQRDYKFMNTVKKNYEKIFVVNYINSILEAINLF